MTSHMLEEGVNPFCLSGKLFHFVNKSQGALFGFWKPQLSSTCNSFTFSLRFILVSEMVDGKVPAAEPEGAPEKGP